MRPIRPLLFAPLLIAMAACSPQDPVDDGDPPYDPATRTDAEMPQPAPAQAPAGVPADGERDDAQAQAATATLQPTQGNDTRGELRFEMADGHVHVTGQVTGLQPGSEHGFHVHEFGDCSAPDGTSAGGHFNPHDSAHGRAGQGEHHVGDSDNLVANDEGVAEVDRQLHGATIGDGGAADIVGKGVIVHADADDYESQPTGNAGDRLACGVIEIM
ncbi:superoxide dismutase family protein [Luteimonas sp. JM171]|uniref:superoxide dismutase family protein n=1 Tax=Luteimonas sp. JM171 TaxID=1896164 RepID=UPI000858B5CF|nr:superoxide dismutase family protein [Luteimonas sp. JM171]AOH35690.1 hypothetical protein BGP89_04400 [Luteimonas sp. JM171]